MTEQLIAKVRVVRAGNRGEIASTAPENLRKEDVDRIANVTNLVVVNLQNQLQVKDEERAPNGLELSELELAFGIDLQVEGKIMIPIIGPLFSAGAKAGATFQVHVRLSRNNS